MTGRYGLHETQKPYELVPSLVTDAVGWKHDPALTTISEHAGTLRAVAAKYNVNPQVLGAVLYDEIRHVKPVVEEITLATGMASTFGLGRVVKFFAMS